MGKPLLYPDDANIIAIAVDHELEGETPIQILDLNNPQQIADFIEKKLLH